MATAAIVVPCYNEAERLDGGQFQEFICPSHDVRFMFVNDGSTDGTLGLLQSLKESNPRKFMILDSSRNSGKAEAVRQGLLAVIASQPDYVGFWDADLATPLEAITSFLDLAESRPDLEVIIGSRVKLLGRRIDRRATRHFLGRIFATAVSLALRLDVYDTQCGAKLFRVSPSIYVLFSEPFHSRWIFDVEIIARLIQNRRGKELPQAENVIYEFPLMSWRDVPGSKLEYSDFFKSSWELTRIYRIYLRGNGNAGRLESLWSHMRHHP